MGRIPRAGKRGHVSAILRPSRLAGAAGIARAASRPIARARSARISGPASVLIPTVTGIALETHAALLCFGSLAAFAVRTLPKRSLLPF